MTKIIYLVNYLIAIHDKFINTKMTV